MNRLRIEADISHEIILTPDEAKQAIFEFVRKLHPDTPDDAHIFLAPNARGNTFISWKEARQPGPPR